MKELEGLNRDYRDASRIEWCRRMVYFLALTTVHGGQLLRSIGSSSCPL